MCAKLCAICCLIEATLLREIIRNNETNDLQLQMIETGKPCCDKMSAMTASGID